MDEGNGLKEALAQAKAVLEERLDGRKPPIGLILGSGLGPVADALEDAVVIPFDEVPSMKRSTALGHAGRFVCGTIAGRCVIAEQGRLHGYEGYSAQEVAFPVWLMHSLGVRTLIVTNAVGAINPDFEVGDFCLITDHINFTGQNPITGIDPDGLAPRFFPMLDAYDPRLRSIARSVAERQRVPLREGVYLGLLGPSFETPAEIRAFRGWGADTVAMSVVWEVIAARHVSMEVLGISLISNMACGVDPQRPDDMDVLGTAQAREADFCHFIEGILGEI